MRHAMRPLCLLLLAAAPVPAAAQSLDPEALKLISDTAASICGDFAKLEGSESDASLEGSAQAKLAGLAGKLVNLGVEGAGKITDSEYVGVLREQLGDELKDVRACRLQVWKDLQATVLAKPAAPAPAAPAPAPIAAPAEVEPMAGFLYPFTETMDSGPADLAGYGPDELRVMRNEIYARGGLIFQSPDLRALFAAMPWYRPVTGDPGAVWNAMSDRERGNVLAIKAAEAGH